MRKIEEKDLLKQNKLSADEYQKAKKLKGFNKADYSFDSNNQLYTKKENLITITQEIKIGENILEPGDKIKILTESFQADENDVWEIVDQNDKNRRFRNHSMFVMEVSELLGAPYTDYERFRQAVIRMFQLEDAYYESKKLREEFIELMRDDRGNMVDKLIDDITNAFNNWMEGTYNNYSDIDAQEWGHRNLGEMVQEAKSELIGVLQNNLDMITR